MARQLGLKVPIILMIMSFRYAFADRTVTKQSLFAFDTYCQSPTSNRWNKVMVFNQPREMLLGQAIMHCARINKRLTDSYDCRDTWRNTYNARAYWMRPKSTSKFFDSNNIDWYKMLTPKRAVVCEGDLETPEPETLKSEDFQCPSSNTRLRYFDIKLPYWEAVAVCAKVNGDIPLKTSCPIRFMEDIGHRVGTKPITWLQHGGESLEVGIGSNGAKHNIATLTLTTELKVVCELPKQLQCHSEPTTIIRYFPVKKIHFCSGAVV
eukprot:scpid17200/ scgid26410/ 